MAYNNYNSSNNYSPYYQAMTGQDGVRKYSGTSGNTEGYQNSSYQPLSTYQTSQQQSQSSAPQSTSSSAYTHGTQGYSNINGAGTSRAQEKRTSYTTNRRQTDTTALGNLAYASTLGRDNTPSSQDTNYNRTQTYGSSGSYGINSAIPAPYGVSHQQLDGRKSADAPKEDHTSSSQTATSAAGASYVPNSAGQQGSTGSTWQTQAQFIAAQKPSAEQSRLSQYISQLQRPSSGQAVQHPSSRASPQVTNSPTIPSTQVSWQKSSNIIHAQRQNRVESPQRHLNQTSGTPTGSQVGNLTTKLQSSTQPPPGTAPSTQQSQVNGLTSQSSTPTASDYPTTVDPSQVFNHVEYQRRQAAAAAEHKATKAAQAAKRPKPNPLNNPSPWKAKPALPQPTGTVPAIAQGPGDSGDGEDADTAKKNQMELEMKLMIEKMRDYKSKDPSLFSQIWEQVKKGQPPQRTPSTAAQGSPSPVVINDQSQSPNAAVQLPPESELPAAESAFPLGFDRGRYPAQRRRRGGKDYTPERTAKSHHKKVTPSASASTPLPDSFVVAASSTDPARQTMQQAMAEFNRNSGSPMPQKPQNVQPPSIHNQAMHNQAMNPIALSSSSPMSATDGQLQPPKAGGTYWPENKKRALAEAARTALNSQDTNKGKQISVDEIHELLNQNPSYTQMCEILEYRGFSTDRSQFARLLLKAVPDMGSASTPQTTASTPSTSSAPVERPPPPPRPQSQVPGLIQKAPQPAPPDMNGYVMPYTISGAARQSQPGQSSHGVAPVAQYHGNGFVNPAIRATGSPFTGTTGISAPSPTRIQTTSSSAGTKNGLERAVQPTPIPDSSRLSQIANKEQMAKKRSFADIVDLTALSDDESEPPSQRPRPNDTIPMPTTAIPTSLPFDTDPILKGLDTGISRGLQNDTETSKSIRNDSNLQDLKYEWAQGELHQNKDIVRPMKKREDALRRSSYNARTIARDILIAIGKHSTMYALNGHLYPLRDQFQAVDINSDLSTFRWDLVDPGGEDMSTQAPRLATAGSATRSRPIGPRNSGQQRMPHPPISADNSNSNSNQSDHSFARFVQNYIPSMQTPFIGAGSEDPSFGGISKKSNIPLTKLPTLAIPASGDVPKKKGGRPPGARKKNPRSDKGTPKKSQGTPISSTKPFGIIIQTPSSSHKSSIPTRPRTNTTPARPSSLRNAMSPGSSAGFAVIIPSRSPSIASTPHVLSYADSQASSGARRGRPKKGLIAVNNKHPSQPEYKVYKCRWEECPAELHNLETLKKHVRKHRTKHGKGPYPCLWANCSRPGAGNPIFETDAEWDKHMEGIHVDAVAWALGDGPTTHSSDYDTESSRQVTPMTSISKRSRHNSASPAPKSVPNLLSTPSNSNNVHGVSPPQSGFRIVI